MKQSQKKRNKRRDAVMDAALKLFSSHGFDKTTVSLIATASGMPEATIYAYFRNKEDILFTLGERFARKLRMDLELHFLGVEGDINRFRKFLWHHLYAFEENPLYCRLFSLELLNNPRYRTSTSFEVLMDYRRELRKIVDSGIENGVFSKRISSYLAEIMVFGTMHHMMLSKVVLEKPLDLVSRANVLFDLFMGALLTDSYPPEKVIRIEHCKRHDILTAALHEFHESGFQQATMAKIAARAGVTEPTIYEHFTNKKELLFAIPEAAMAGYLVESVDRDLNNQDTPVNRFRTFLLHQVRSARDFPEYYYLLITELRSNVDFYKSPHYSSLREYSGRLNSILHEGVLRGFFRPDLDCQSARDFYFGTLDELILSPVIVDGSESITAFAEDVFDILFHAFSVCYPKTSQQAS